MGNTREDFRYTDTHEPPKARGHGLYFGSIVVCTQVGGRACCEAKPPARKRTDAALRIAGFQSILASAGFESGDDTCSAEKDKAMIKAVSLFTGCGGSDRGLVDAGCKVLMANDILAYAKEVYEANLPETDFKIGSIDRIKAFPAADVLAGCYPCQGYCQGGARQAGRKINTLYREFDRALRKIRPKVFIVENVPGMARSDNRHFLNAQLVRFRSAGYRVNWDFVNAVQYGLAQERRRIFIVGIRSDFGLQYQFPKPTHGPGLKPVKTQQDLLENLKEKWPHGEFSDQDFHWYYLSRNRYRGWNEPSKTILANARHMPLHPMSPPLKKIDKDQWIFEGDPKKARRFSYKEAAALQDLGGWKFPDTAGLNSKYKVIGNAVPPMIFRQIFEALPKEVFA